MMLGMLSLALGKMGVTACSNGASGTTVPNGPCVVVTAAGSGSTGSSQQDSFDPGVVYSCVPSLFYINGCTPTSVPSMIITTTYGTSPICGGLGVVLRTPGKPAITANTYNCLPWSGSS